MLTCDLLNVKYLNIIQILHCGYISMVGYFRRNTITARDEVVGDNFLHRKIIHYVYKHMAVFDL